MWSFWGHDRVNVETRDVATAQPAQLREGGDHEAAAQLWGAEAENASERLPDRGSLLSRLPFRLSNDSPTLAPSTNRLVLDVLLVFLAESKGSIPWHPPAFGAIRIWLVREDTLLPFLPCKDGGPARWHVGGGDLPSNDDTWKHCSNKRLRNTNCGILQHVREDSAEDGPRAEKK